MNGLDHWVTPPPPEKFFTIFQAKLSREEVDKFLELFRQLDSSRDTKVDLTGSGGITIITLTPLFKSTDELLKASFAEDGFLDCWGWAKKFSPMKNEDSPQ